MKLSKSQHYQFWHRRSFQHRNSIVTHALSWFFASLLPSLLLAQESTSLETSKNSEGWVDLIKPGSLDGWTKTNFGGEGAVQCDKDGVIHLAVGEPMTGITFEGEFPKDNFEVRWKARRMQGSDFLVGLTFPMQDTHCSWIAGGWGGSLVGLSSINSSDASENETTEFFTFKNEQWYSFWIRVDAERITATIDDKQVINVPRADRRFSIRGEMRDSRPFGYAVFRSSVEIKDFQYRVISP